jgi:PilZ domain
MIRNGSESLRLGPGGQGAKKKKNIPIDMDGTQDMTTATADRRRSDRLWLTIPLRVEGLDSKGQSVEYPGRAINLNRHGGRIQVPQELDRNHSIRLRSPIGRFESEFRVVETLADPGGNGLECGVECLNQEDNFWGIEFPSNEMTNAPEAKVLLECRTCHTIALVPLAFLEIVTLSTISMVGLECTKCSALTFWRYAEIRVPMNREPAGAPSAMERRSNWIASLSETIERGHRRVYVQMQLGIRDCKGKSDVVRTENISECGFCFSAERQYSQGEIVTAAFPISSVTHFTQMPARIVREQVMEGSLSKMYGATFGAGNGGCHGV